MRNFSNSSKLIFLSVLLIAYTAVAALAQYSPSATTGRKIQTQQEKKQQLQQEVSTVSPELTSKYNEILSFVNSAQSPSEPNLKEYLKVVAKDRKYLTVFNDSQKNNYFLFSAWVYYFDDKQDRAVKQAVLAQKNSPKNQNIIKTRLALSILYKDYASAVEALTEPNANNRPGPKHTDGQTEDHYQEGSETTLGLEVNAVKIPMLGQTFDFHPEPVSANSPPWQTAGTLNCVLLWKIDANELDSFAPPPDVKPAEVNEPNEPNEPNAPPKESNLPPLLPEPEPSIKPIPALDEFSKLQSQFAENKKIAFTRINLNNPEKIKNLENWLSKKPQPWPAFILSADRRQKMLSYFNEDFDKPVLLIVAPDSTIRYAGDAEGFLPKMVIRGILQNPQEFVPKDSNEPNKPQPLLLPVPPEPNAIQPKDSNESNKPQLQPLLLPVPPESNAIQPRISTAVSDVNKPVINTPPPQPIPAPNTIASAAKNQLEEGFSAVDDYQAQTLLSNARTFLKIGNKLPSHAYADPIKWCRQVMKDCPNTKYAQEAQMLLRNVPKEHREQYNLTDEELGL